MVTCVFVIVRAGEIAPCYIEVTAYVRDIVLIHSLLMADPHIEVIEFRDHPLRCSTEEPQ